MEILKNSMFSQIYEVDCFQKEFVEMTKERLAVQPPFPRYQKWLIGKLYVLDELKEDAIKLRDFEYLEGTMPKLYAIRYPKSKLNPRVIYACLDEGEILLLTVFKEKNSSDYNRHIKLAQRRMKELQRE